MFIGHYGPSFVAKRVDPTIPLWVLVLSAHLMDVFWTVSMFVLPTPPSPDALVSRLLAFYVVLTATAFWIDRGNRAVV